MKQIQVVILLKRKTLSIEKVHVKIEGDFPKSGNPEETMNMDTGHTLLLCVYATSILRRILVAPNRLLQATMALDKTSPENPKGKRN